MVFLDKKNDQFDAIRLARFVRFVRVVSRWQIKYWRIMAATFAMKIDHMGTFTDEKIRRFLYFRIFNVLGISR